jgi:L-alanine-DL-glutamate epimerase-like enolase superfamily enzyme
LLDTKAKALGVPCCVLLGGKVHDRVRVYWSHCATWRINHPTQAGDHQARRRQGARWRSAREGLYGAEDQYLPL